MSIINFINYRARNFTVFGFSLISLIIFPFITIIATATLKQYYGLIIGIVLMIAAIPFHCIAKKHNALYVISFLLNTIANGFSLSALYTSKKTNLIFDDLLLAIIPSAIILLLTYLLLRKSKKIALTIIVILNTLLTIAFTIFWIIRGGVFYSFGFFCSLILLFYLCVFGVTVNHNERSVLRDISFGSFGAFVILTIVVLFIIYEGEIIDGLDVPDIDLNSRKNKPKSQI